MVYLFGYGYGYGGLGFYFDPTYYLVIAGALICMLASAHVNSAMNKYKQVSNRTGITGADCARRILNNEGLYNVQIECLGKNAGDHYDPRTNTVRLSYDNYHYASITARAKGMKVIGLTGRDGGLMRSDADVAIIVPEKETYKIQ